jgi:hypothetical protein
MKHLFAVNLFGQLDHAALWAKRNFQFEKVFVRKLIFAEKTVGDRHPPNDMNGSIATPQTKQFFILKPALFRFNLTRSPV